MKKIYNEPILDISMIVVADVLSASDSDGNFATGDELFQ